MTFVLLAASSTKRLECFLLTTPGLSNWWPKPSCGPQGIKQYLQGSWHSRCSFNSSCCAAGVSRFPLLPPVFATCPHPWGRGDSMAHEAKGSHGWEPQGDLGHWWGKAGACLLHNAGGACAGESVQGQGRRWCRSTVCGPGSKVEGVHVACVAGVCGQPHQSPASCQSLRSWTALNSPVAWYLGYSMGGDGFESHLRQRRT